ncbi:PspA/IM30 family protein [Bifidobacterium gallicum]|uniref:Phage-shock protein n=1 Tax=Bifidobacterium gallicum DSM 20093 = LMG 11596 TaxID=561180 RepID=D1NVP5_9BIFI|nr:PspA/IM30 family protein [Bifidobacterium gallicum]EFA22896.1 PspA/IM30 family protein [Bifidobacterium gallicum DSM 20093 = LMG 11596]KFI59402.1 phage-shock protein [Bifidobacterium gallicum DSM 20093 = LMG 11596]
MGILQRFSDIMRSNINALLDKAEDPAKLVDQMLLDLRKDLAEVKKETAGVMADATRAKRDLDACDQEIARYDKAARAALQAGNEGDARALLAKKVALQESRESLAKVYDMSEANAKKMREMHDKLVSDINSLETRRSTIKAKVAAAKAQQHMNDITSGGDRARSSMEAFDRMEDKADKMLDQAQAASELNGQNDPQSDLADKYLSGANSPSVDDELAQLKASMGM